MPRSKRERFGRIGSESSANAADFAALNRPLSPPSSSQPGGSFSASESQEHDVVGDERVVSRTKKRSCTTKKARKETDGELNSESEADNAPSGRDETRTTSQSSVQQDNRSLHHDHTNGLSEKTLSDADSIAILELLLEHMTRLFDCEWQERFPDKSFWTWVNIQIAARLGYRVFARWSDIKKWANKSGQRRRTQDVSQPRSFPMDSSKKHQLQVIWGFVWDTWDYVNSVWKLWRAGINAFGRAPLLGAMARKYQRAEEDGDLEHLITDPYTWSAIQKRIERLKQMGPKSRDWNTLLDENELDRSETDSVTNESRDPTSQETELDDVDPAPSIETSPVTSPTVTKKLEKYEELALQTRCFPPITDKALNSSNKRCAPAMSSDADPPTQREHDDDLLFEHDPFRAERTYCDGFGPPPSTSLQPSSASSSTHDLYTQSCDTTVRAPRLGSRKVSSPRQCSEPAEDYASNAGAKAICSNDPAEAATSSGTREADENDIRVLDSLVDSHTIVDIHGSSRESANGHRRTDSGDSLPSLNTLAEHYKSQPIADTETQTGVTSAKTSNRNLFDVTIRRGGPAEQTRGEAELRKENAEHSRRRKNLGREHLPNVQNLQAASVQHSRLHITETNDVEYELRPQQSTTAAAFQSRQLKSSHISTRKNHGNASQTAEHSKRPNHKGSSENRNEISDRGSDHLRTGDGGPMQQIPPDQQSHQIASGGLIAENRPETNSTGSNKSAIPPPNTGIEGRQNEGARDTAEAGDKPEGDSSANLSPTMSKAERRRRRRERKKAKVIPEEAVCAEGSADTGAEELERTDVPARPKPGPSLVEFHGSQAKRGASVINTSDQQQYDDGHSGTDKSSKKRKHGQSISVPQRGLGSETSRNVIDEQLPHNKTEPNPHSAPRDLVRNTCEPLSKRGKANLDKFPSRTSSAPSTTGRDTELSFDLSATPSPATAIHQPAPPPNQGDGGQGQRSENGSECETPQMGVLAHEGTKRRRSSILRTPTVSRRSRGRNGDRSRWSGSRTVRQQYRRPRRDADSPFRDRGEQFRHRADMFLSRGNLENRERGQSPGTPQGFATPAASTGLFVSPASGVSGRFGGRSASTRRFGTHDIWSDPFQEERPEMRAPSGPARGDRSMTVDTEAALSSSSQAVQIKLLRGKFNKVEERMEKYNQNMVEMKQMHENLREFMERMQEGNQDNSLSG